MRIVVDCNIFISAALTPLGTCRRALAEAIKNHEILLSEEILKEYREVANRKKFAAIRDRIHVLIEEVALRATFVLAVVSDDIPGISDEDDAVYVVVAVNEGADAIVTGNTRHFTAPFYGSALVVSAREFLDMVGG
jgi:putative PIN family toxin of toxin-antitoxin system